MQVLSSCFNKIRIPLSKMPKTKKIEISIEKDRPEKKKKPRAQHYRTVRYEENITRVRESVLQNPAASIRQRAQLLGITPKTLQRILKDDLNLSIQKQVEHNPVAECNETMKESN